MCYKLHGYPPQSRPMPTDHHANALSTATNNDWIIDSGASHHITNDLDQLHISAPY